jgi:ABC-type sugar transport system substrate-binding protein
MSNMSRPARLLFAIGCIALLGAALAACGKTSGESSPSGGGGDSTAAGSGGGGESSGGSSAVSLDQLEEGKLKIGFSNYAAVIPLYQSMIAGIEDGAKKYGWSVEVTDSKFEPNKQVSDIQSLITKGVDLLIVSPGDAHALLPAYQEAAREGIPIISIANSLAPEDSAWETAFFGVSNETVGEEQTEALIQAMGGKGEVIQVNGPSGVDFVTEMTQGAKNVFSQQSGVKVAFEGGTKELSAAEGLRVGQAGLTAHPDIQGGWANDDELAVGLVRALTEQGLAGKAPVAWNGGTAQAMDLAAKGDLVGVILPTYTWGIEAMEGIHAAINGEGEFSGRVLGKMFPLESAEQAKELIAQCPQEPDQIWCLGR